MIITDVEKILAGVIAIVVVMLLYLLSTTQQRVSIKPTYQSATAATNITSITDANSYKVKTAAQEVIYINATITPKVASTQTTFTCALDTSLSWTPAKPYTVTIYNGTNNVFSTSVVPVVNSNTLTISFLCNGTTPHSMSLILYQ